ncbi:predicted protein [Histoplasma capsulatum H143]|uniref:Uncharacterized protein n=1 Tax=Ajellomyces capsulatus (strain H143) TaxID=544712 RepID=C6H799_AJECH|nr:predicted protein [Histoplasma capsulatum H143]
MARNPKPFSLFARSCNAKPQGLPEGTTHPRQWIYISFGTVEMIIIDKEEGREGDEEAGNVGGWSSAGSGHEAAIGALLESVVSNWSQATKLNTAVQGWLRGLFGGENSRDTGAGFPPSPPLVCSSPQMRVKGLRFCALLRRRTSKVHSHTRSLSAFHVVKDKFKNLFPGTILADH